MAVPFPSGPSVKVKMPARTMQAEIGNWKCARQGDGEWNRRGRRESIFATTVLHEDDSVSLVHVAVVAREVPATTAENSPPCARRRMLVLRMSQ